MNNASFERRRCLGWRVAVCFLSLGGLQAQQPPTPANVATEAQTLGLNSGLAVVAGNPGLAQDFAGALPDWPVLGLTATAQEADSLRSALSGSGEVGRVVVLPLGGAYLPVATRSVALLVVDESGLGPLMPSDSEITRALRPLGTAWVRRGGSWNRIEATWPSSLGDWNHWFGDSTFDQMSDDTEVGPVRTLRWHSDRAFDGRDGDKGIMWMAAGVLVTLLPEGLTGLDAFTGLRLWRREGRSFMNNVAIAMDEDRIVLWEAGSTNWSNPNDRINTADQYLVALDPRTGEIIKTYDQFDIRAIGQGGFLGNPMINLAGNRIYVTCRNVLAVIDATTGDTRTVTFPEGTILSNPATNGSQLVVAAGTSNQFAKGHNNNIEPSLTMQQLVVYDVNYLEPVERWRWTQDIDSDARVTSLFVKDGKVWVTAWRYASGNASHMFTTRRIPLTGPGQGIPDLSLVIPEGTNADKEADPFPIGDSIYVGGQNGKLTSKNRTFVFNGQTGQPTKNLSFNLGNCALVRATPNWLFATTVAISTQGPNHDCHWTRVMGAHCRRSSFPAHGQLVLGDSVCDCFQSLHGLGAFGPDLPPPAVGNVTVSGPGSPGTPLPGDAWRTANRDAERTAWSTVPLDVGNLQVSPPISVVSATSGSSELLSDQWQRHHSLEPLSQPVLADGFALVSVPHEHRVVAINPQTGGIVWSYRAGGRIYGPPSVYGGLALIGTAMGWVEAVSIANGSLVWRTRVAPVERFIVENGQLESLHPVAGSPTVIDDRVYVSTGIHSHLDGGLHFAELDLHSGQVLRRWTGNTSIPVFSGVASTTGTHAGLAPFADSNGMVTGGDYPSADLTVAYPQQVNGFLTRSPQGWLGLGMLALDPASNLVRQGGRDFAWASASHHGTEPNPVAAKNPRWPLLRHGASFAKRLDKVSMLGIRADAFAQRDNKVVALYGTPSQNWRQSYSRTLVTMHEVRPVVNAQPGATSGSDIATIGLWNKTIVQSVDKLKPSGQAPQIADNVRPVQALAVTPNAVVYANDKRLGFLRSDNGAPIRELEFPSPIVEGGIAVADGKIVVSCLSGQLFFVTANGSGGTGNQAPTAAFSATPLTGTAPLAVAFNGSGSSDPENSALNYSWTFGDGTTGAGVTANHIYNNPGTYITTLTVTDSAGASDSAQRTILVEAPASPWADSDIGAVAVAGSTTWTSSTGEFFLTGSGSGINNTASEELQAYLMEHSGDFTLEARVVSVTNTNAWAMAGVMVRETLQPGSRFAAMAMTSGTTHGAAFVRRVTTGAASGVDSKTIGLQPPYWVKLVRTGNGITTYRSADGQTWTQQGYRSIAMVDPVQIGLFVTANNDGQLCTAVIDNVSLDGLPVTP